MFKSSSKDYKTMSRPAMEYAFNVSWDPHIQASNKSLEQCKGKQPALSSMATQWCNGEQPALSSVVTNGGLLGAPAR